MKNAIKGLSKKYRKEIISVRRYLHAHPELSFQEHHTSEFVQEKLGEYGIAFQNNIAGTGILATIKGKKPNSKTIALRADMDALPIKEKNKVPYKSKNVGVMHACGHDVHTSSLLGVCRILNELKGDFKGTVKFLFQPAEEIFPGGASLMIKEGVLKNPVPKSILGQHVYSSLPAGTVGFKPGLFMASADEIILRVKGKGGHGAVPHRAIDPIVVCSQIIVSLQQVISRMCDPTIPSVLTFGKIKSAGGSFNVIPDMVQLKGTFRTFSEYWRYKAHDHIKEVASNVANAFGAEIELEITVGYPFLVNNEELTLRCRDAAIAYLGPDHVQEVPLRLTSEDFSYYTHHVSGCFYRLGIANSKKGITSPVHSPYFDIDEGALETGMGLMAYLAIKELEN
jgi:amidohydrolase